MENAGGATFDFDADVAEHQGERVDVGDVGDIGEDDGFVG